MPLLAQLVVEYAADLSDLESGTQRALDLMDQFGSAASSGPAILEGVFTELADEAISLSTAIDEAGQASQTASDAMLQASEATDTLASSFRDRALASADAFIAKIEQTASPITTFASNISDRAGTALTQFGSMLTNASQPVVDFAERISTGIGRGISSLQTRLTDAKESVTSFTSHLATSAGEIVSRVSSPFEQAGLVISGFALKAKDSIDEVTGTIKDRLVSITSPLSEFISRIREASPPLASFGEFVQNATSPLQGLITRLGEATSSLMKFGSSASESGGSLVSGIGEKIGSVGSNLLDFGSKLGMTIMGIQMLAQGAQSLGSAFLSPNASMEQTQVAFKQLLGSSSAATNELKDLQQFAASTPFQFPELAESTQKLIAFQIPLKDTRPLLTAIGDSLSGLGEGTPAKLSQVVDVFGQMNSAGKIQTQDLMQLTSVGINGFQLLADQMHKPVSVIKDMVTSGTIPATKGIEMLRAGMEKTFGGGMQAQAMTFNGLLSTFQDNVGSAMRAFTGPLFDQAKGALTNLGNLVASPNFQAFATTMGQNVGNALRTVGTFINTNVMPPLHQMQAALQSPQAQQFATTMSNLGGVFNSILAPGLRIVQTLFNSIVPPMTSGTNAGTTLRNSLADISSVVQNQIIPPLQGFATNLQNLSVNLQRNKGLLDTFKVALAGIGAAVLTPIIIGFTGWAIAAGAAAISTIALALPVLAIAAGIGLLVAGFILLYQHSAPFRAIIAGIGTVFQTLWSTLMANLMPALTNLWNVIQAQLMPAWTQLQAAITPIMPTLQFIGELIAGVVVVALGLLIGVIVAVVTAVSGMIPGLVQAFVGVVQVISGVVQVIQGIVMFVVDLVTGHFDRLGADLGMIWGGIVRMFQGVWNMIAGSFSAGIGFVVGFVSGFIATVIGFFSNLYDTLIGHSIVPDMINGIIDWFKGLPGKAVSALGGLVSSIGGVFTDLKNSAFTWMSDMIGNIVGGINSGIDSVRNAASNIAGVISDILHHTVPSEGPLMNDDKWMIDFGANMANGLNDQVGNVRTAALNVAGAIAGASGTANIGINATGSSSLAGGGPSRSAQIIYVHMQSSQSDVYLDKEKVGKSLTNWQKDVAQSGRRSR